MSDTRDFSPKSATSGQTSHVNFDVEAGRRSSTGSKHRPLSTRSEGELKLPGIAPLLMRRQSRNNTKSFSTVHNQAVRPNWRPGQEPGLDPSKPNGGRQQSLPNIPSQITVVDYSEEDMVMQDFNNEQFIDFLKKPQEPWIKCRWINVNGLSWDVIQALGKKKGLHRLALEDLVNTNNRTKADWYTSHTYIVLTLQKLVHLHRDAEDTDSDDDSVDSIGGTRKRGGFSKYIHKLLHGTKMKKKYDEKKQDASIVGGVHDPNKEVITGHTEGLVGVPTQKLRSLQRYHGAGNQERMAYMEAHSPLSKRRLAVCAEQVSMFITNDNCVISFFETSADDIEEPILHRLDSSETILRKSCDASMLAQAVMDAIIDLGLPVVGAYEDVLGQLELEVLTQPDISNTNTLYILTSEITMMRNFISPIVNLINALRDHKGAAINPGVSSRSETKAAATGVIISPLAQTYLGDVEDHIILMTESLDQMRRSCDNMIDLQFNSVAAIQNESIKQLTVVTIIFLPLSFLTGYFGMNIVDFPSIHHSESYFWEIAVPVAVIVSLFLMRDVLKWWFQKFLQRRGISKHRKGRLDREARAKRNS